LVIASLQPGAEQRVVNDGRGRGACPHEVNLRLHVTAQHSLPDRFAQCGLDAIELTRQVQVHVESRGGGRF
jgi:hypothetical protein